MSSSACSADFAAGPPARRIDSVTSRHRCWGLTPVSVNVRQTVSSRSGSSSSGPDLAVAAADEGLVDDRQAVAVERSPKRSRDLNLFLGGARNAVDSMIIHDQRPPRLILEPVWIVVPYRLPASGLELSSRARTNTPSSISSVSRPVNVFCWLGW